MIDQAEEDGSYLKRKRKNKTARLSKRFLTIAERDQHDANARRPKNGYVERVGNIFACRYRYGAGKSYSRIFYGKGALKRACAFLNS